jgi:hypothetical protein
MKLATTKPGLANRKACGALLAVGLRLNFEPQDIARLCEVPPEHLSLPGENQSFRINITP